MRDRLGDTFGRDFQSDLESDMAGYTWTMTQNGLKKAEVQKAPQPVSERPAPAPAKVLAMVAQAPSVTVSMPNLIELLSAGFRP